MENCCRKQAMTECNAAQGSLTVQGEEHWWAGVAHLVWWSPRALGHHHWRCWGLRALWSSLLQEPSAPRVLQAQVALEQCVGLREQKRRIIPLQLFSLRFPISTLPDALMRLQSTE